MCYCHCHGYGYGFGYGFNSDWMAAAWGLNMLSNMVRDITRQNINQSQSQSGNNGNINGNGNGGLNGASGNANHGGNNNSVFTNNSNLCGDLLTNPNANINSNISMGGSLFNYLPGSNQFGCGGIGGVPTEYAGFSGMIPPNFGIDNTNLGPTLGSMGIPQNMDITQIPGLSPFDTTSLMPIPSLLQLIAPTLQTQPQAQQQAQPQAQVQPQTQVQPQAQVQSQTQLQTQAQVQTNPQTVQPHAQAQVSVQSDVTTPYTGTAADLNAKLGGALAGKGQIFLNAQQQFGINAAFLASICMHESANGTSNLARTKNNVGGVRIAGSTEFRTYNSVDECIMHMATFLKRSYLDRGLTTIAQIGAKYCPTNDPTDRAGMNSGWGAGVSRWYNQSFA